MSDQEKVESTEVNADLAAFRADQEAKRDEAIRKHNTEVAALQAAAVAWHDYRNFMKAAMCSLASNSHFFATGGGVNETEIVKRLQSVAHALWLTLPPLHPQQAAAAAPAPAPQQSHLPYPQPAVAPPAQAYVPPGQVAPIPSAAQPAGTSMPAYQPLPGFMGGSQQVSVGGVPNVQGHAVPMGATVASPHGGGVGSGVPFQQPMPAGQQVKVIAENFQGQNLGPGQVPGAGGGQQVQVHNAPPTQPGRF